MARPGIRWMEHDMVWSGASMIVDRTLARAPALVLAVTAMLLVSAQAAAGAQPELTIGSPTPGSVTSNARPPFSGTTSDEFDAVTVNIHEGSATGPLTATLQTVLPPLLGQWSLTPEADLESGQYTAVAEQRPEFGEAGESPPVTFTVDLTPPAVTIAAQPSLSNDSTPTLTGAAGTAAGDIAAVNVTIYKGTGAGGTVASTGPAKVNGSSWSYTPSVALLDGTYTAEATQSDEAGNVGHSPVLTTFTVDLTPPAVTIAAHQSPSNDSTPTLTGEAGITPGDIAAVTVTIYKGGTPVETGPAEVNGSNWSYTPPTALSDGTYTAEATQSDQAGNIGHSSPTTFKIDTVKPKVSLSTPKNGRVEKVAKTNFSGGAGTESGDSGFVVLYIEGESESGPLKEQVEHLEVTAGKWLSEGPALPNGIYTARVVQGDEAGNFGESPPVTFTIDTDQPPVTLSVSTFVTRGSSRVTSATPSFSGTASQPSQEVSPTAVVNVYAGTSTHGAKVGSVEGSLNATAWSAGPVAALPDGTYTAQAEQADTHPDKLPGLSAPVTFTVDADAPQVSLVSPVDGSSTSGSSQALSGSAGTAAGDSNVVSVQLYAGTSIAGAAALQAVTVPVQGGGWSAAFGGLTPGTYTAQAEQRDDVGNAGHSAPVTFTVTPPVVVPAVSSRPTSPPPPAPTASFQWFPAAPHVGEAIALVSTSTDPGSALNGFAWALSSSGGLIAGSSVLHTTFWTPGDHVVRLGVTDANGQSSVVTETVPVTVAAPAMLQPFPIVRIAGTDNAFGVRINLLTVQAPVGAWVSVACHGPGCPLRAQRLRAVAGRSRNSRTVLIGFRRFQRSLRPGATLEIRVSKHGQIGKYTRFVVRQGKLPTRIDTCLAPAGIKPMVCPA